MVRPTSSRGQPGGIAEVDGNPLVIVQAVGPPSWERACIRFGGMGCSGFDEHAYRVERLPQVFAALDPNIDS